VSPRAKDDGITAEDSRLYTASRILILELFFSLKRIFLIAVGEVAR